MSMKEVTNIDAMLGAPIVPNSLNRVDERNSTKPAFIFVAERDKIRGQGSIIHLFPNSMVHLFLTAGPQSWGGGKESPEK